MSERTKGMIKILPRRAFVFEVGKVITSDNIYKCVPGVIQDMDEKFTKCMMFDWAVNSGEIDIIRTSAELKAAENDEHEGKEKKRAKSKASDDKAVDAK